MSEFLIPRRQHHHGGWVDFAVGLQGLADRLPGTVEQQVIQQLAIAKDQGREEIGQCKHDLKIVHVRQQQFAGLAQPRGASRTHALRAMPIGAGVVDLAPRGTLRTLPRASVEHRGAAQQQLGEHSAQMRGNSPASHELRHELSQDVNHSRPGRRRGRGLRPDVRRVGGFAVGGSAGGRCRAGGVAGGVAVGGV